MYQGPPIERTEKVRKPGSLKPFRRASLYYTQVMELKAKWSHNLVALQAAINAYPPYTSRGHGWGKHVTSRRIDGRWAQDRSKYMPAECMAQGCR